MAISDILQELATDISNAYDSIGNKGGTLPSDKNTNNLATAIGSIQTGITPSGTINITENGIVDVTNYASANVNVQPPPQEALTIYVRPTAEQVVSKKLTIPNPTGIIYDTVMLCSLENTSGDISFGPRQGYATTAPIAYGTYPDYSMLTTSNKATVTVTENEISLSGSGHVYSGIKTGALYAITLYKTPESEV